MIWLPTCTHRVVEEAEPPLQQSEVIQLQMQCTRPRTPREGPHDSSRVEIEMTCPILILGYNLELGNLIT